MNLAHPKRELNVDWFKVGCTVFISVLVVGFTIGIALTISNESRWKEDCEQRGGLIVKTRDEGEACVDSERRIIK